MLKKSIIDRLTNDFYVRYHVHKNPIRLVKSMITTNVTNFRKRIFELLEDAIKYGDIITVTTKNGNAVILSEQDYQDMIETINIYSNSRFHQALLEDMHAPDTDFVDEDKIDW